MTSPRETASDIAGALRGATGEPVFAVGQRVRVTTDDFSDVSHGDVAEVLNAASAPLYFVKLQSGRKRWLGARHLDAAHPGEPDSLTVFGYECRRTYPATWRADSGLPSALSIVVREWPKTSTSPPGISVSVYQSATCLATAEASRAGDAEAACGMRLGQVVDAIRQLLTHGGE